MNIKKIFPWQLSQGMRQRFELIQALCFRPRLMVIDEGLSGIHHIMRDKAIRILARSCAEFGMSLVFTSHNVPDAMRLADDVLNIQDGKVLEQISVVPQRDARIGMPSDQLLTIQDLQWLLLGNH